MSLPPSFLDELRQRIGLNALVGRRVKLQRAGREMKGCCPFHNEKTPSFYVNEDKGFFHCFGCGAHGDAIGWTMQIDALPFLDAVKQLAAEAGLEVPAASPQAAAREEAARTLHDTARAAEDWFRQQLAGAGGAKARAYLAERGLAAATQADFALGWAPNERQALRSALKSHTDAKLLDAGLLGQPEGEAAPYDRFRARLIFPIHDPRGRTVGFGGRVLDDAKPKYLNSPDGPLFDKGRLLFNHHRAAPLARQSGRLLIAEGYLDVIALHAAGFPAVAPLGTAITETQLELAWRLVPEPFLCLDGDSAGQRAAVRAAIRALPVLAPGRSLRFATLPPGQDPDDLLRSAGPAALEALLAAAVPLDRLLFDHEAAAGPLDTPERRAALRERLNAHADAIADKALQRDYRDTWNERISELTGRRRMPFTPNRAGQRRDWRTPTPEPLRPATRAAARIPPSRHHWALLAALAADPDAPDRHHEALAALPLADPDLARARDDLLDGRAPSLPRIAPIVAPDAPDFDARVAEALASLNELHHIEAEIMTLRSEPPDDGIFGRQALLGTARADVVRRLGDLAGSQ